MTNNDYFRSLLHLTGVGRDKDLLIEIFRLGDIEATNSKIRGWRASLDSDRASRMPDNVLDGFIQGMFTYRDIQAEKGVNVFNFGADKMARVTKHQVMQFLTNNVNSSVTPELLNEKFGVETKVVRTLGNGLKKVGLFLNGEQIGEITQP